MSSSVPRTCNSSIRYRNYLPRKGSCAFSNYKSELKRGSLCGGDREHVVLVVQHRLNYACSLSERIEGFYPLLLFQQVRELPTYCFSGLRLVFLNTVYCFSGLRLVFLNTFYCRSMLFLEFLYRLPDCICETF